MSQPDTAPEHESTLSSVYEDLSVPHVESGVKADLFSFLGRAHMLTVIHEFAITPGPWRFSELRERLNVPPTTLTDRLKELTRAGLIVRESYDEIPPRVEYTATEKILDLRAVFGCLGIWIADHEWNSAQSDVSE